MLFGVDDELLSICFGLVDLLDCLSSNLIHNDLLSSLSLGDQDRGFFLSLGLCDFLSGVGCEFLLLFVDLGTSDLLLQLIELSLLGSLEVSKLLLLFIVKSKFFVFLLLLMVLEFYLEPCLLLESSDKLWINDDICNIALLKLDSILGKLGVQIRHHRVCHI